MVNPFMEPTVRDSKAIAEFKTRAKLRGRVRFIPRQAHGDSNHPDCIDGAISGFGADVVYVKFDKRIGRAGWDLAVADPCDPASLKVL